MKTISVRELNRRTAQILDGVEGGETYALRRNGKIIGYLTQNQPSLRKESSWESHFEWLQRQKSKKGGFVRELEQERERSRKWEKTLE